jgi:hypothetical protein
LNTRIQEEDCHLLLESAHPHIEKNSLNWGDKKEDLTNLTILKK